MSLAICPNCRQLGATRSVFQLYLDIHIQYLNILIQDWCRMIGKHSTIGTACMWHAFYTPVNMVYRLSVNICTVSAITQKYFLIHFKCGVHVYWDNISDEFENCHRTSLNMHIMTSFMSRVRVTGVYCGLWLLLFYLHFTSYDYCYLPIKSASMLLGWVCWFVCYLPKFAFWQVCSSVCLSVCLSVCWFVRR